MINPIQPNKHSRRPPQGRPARCCVEPHRLKRADGETQLHPPFRSPPRGLQSGLLGCCSACIEKSTLRTKIFYLDRWGPHFLFLSCRKEKEGHGEAFLPNHREIKGLGRRDAF